jgi:hypothetical protein
MEAQHERVTAACARLKPASSALRNGISSHRVASPASFPALDAFATQTLGALGGGDGADRVFVGSIDGELIVSARLRAPGAQPTAEAPAPARSKKRGRDDSADRADRTVAAIRKLLVASDAPVTAAVGLARASIEALLRDFKGVGGEEIVESCGLSLAPTNGDGGRDRPKLIIACRLSAGVPLPLTVLRRALGRCFADGMITTRPELLGEAYRLPLSAAGQAIESQGQRSLLLFAAVPVEAAAEAPAAAPAQAAPPRE